jgi:hypothetical protein
MTQTGKKFIRNGNFCEVVSDKFVEEGIKRGHIVYVAGHKALPISEEDPYTQRIKFFVHLYNEHERTMSKDIYLMDPNSMLPVDVKAGEKFLDEYKLTNGID